MSVRIFHSAFIVLSLAICGCDTDETPEIKEPPRFTLAEIKNYKGGRIASSTATSEPKLAFDLGEIKSSKEYFFLLANGGDDPIYNIKLETNTPGFEVYPKGINVLNGKKTTESTIVPLISIGIEHGEKLNGTGYADVLKMDLNKTTLTLTGKAFQNGDSIDIKSEFDLTVYARVADVTVYSDDVEIDFLNPPYNYNLTTFGAAPYFKAHISNVKVKNTGNVDVSLDFIFRTYENGVDSNKPQQILLKQGETKAITFPTPYVSLVVWDILYSLDCNGVTTNRYRIPQSASGKGYFGISLFP
ncbi:MAG TPA: hypothetical protein VIT44_18480 [Cyclobacteriaceae bacterium]